MRVDARQRNGIGLDGLYIIWRSPMGVIRAVQKAENGRAWRRNIAPIIISISCINRSFSRSLHCVINLLCNPMFARTYNSIYNVKVSALICTYCMVFYTCLSSEMLASSNGKIKKYSKACSKGILHFILALYQ